MCSLKSEFCGDKSGDELESIITNQLDRFDSNDFEFLESTFFQKISFIFYTIENSLILFLIVVNYWWMYLIMNIIGRVPSLETWAEIAIRRAALYSALEHGLPIKFCAYIKRIEGVLNLSSY